MVDAIREMGRAQRRVADNNTSKKPSVRFIRDLADTAHLSSSVEGTVQPLAAPKTTEQPQGKPDQKRGDLGS